MIKVAVLMSAYNGEEYIREQIDSILNQVGNFNLDLYVRDDGSKDKTIDILHEYEKKKKVKWYAGANLRPAKSFMDLLQKCEGYDYYAFADQDDYWFQNKIQKGIERLNCQAGPALYCSNAELVDDKLMSLGRNVYKSTPKTDFETVVCAGGLLGCTMIFNEALAKIARRGKKNNMVLHDFYLAVLCDAINGKIVYDHEASMKYRQHGNNAVGVSYGLFKTVKGRIMDMIHEEPVGIADQAASILNEYNEDIPTEKKMWLKMVAEYKINMINRIKLATSRKTNYINRNMGFKIRFSILLGNR